MEHGDVNPNLETESWEAFGVADFQDGGGVDTNSIAGPSESKEILLIELESNQSIESTKLKNNNDNTKALEAGNNSTIDTTIEDKESRQNHYICKFCSKSFNKPQALGGHMNGHSKEQRNLKKFEKVTTWIHETYPSPPHITLASEVKQQDTPMNEVTYNSYNHPIEVGNVYNQLGRQWTNHQSSQQVQFSQQHQYLQGLKSDEAPKSPQSPQNYQTLQRLQNYQTPQRLQNHQASQGSQNYQIPQQVQNYQTPQELEYYQVLQGSQGLYGSQYYQVPQRFQNYQTPQGSQSFQTPQGSQSFQTLQEFQSYQTPQGPESHQVLQGSQSYQVPQGQWQQLVVDANNQQNINLTSKTSSKPTSFAKAPSNEPKNNLSNSQGPHFQKEVQGPQKYMPNPCNLHNGDHLTTGPFINEQLNKDYYAQFKPNVQGTSNQMISTPQDHSVVAQNRPINLQDISSLFSQSKDE